MYESDFVQWFADECDIRCYDNNNDKIDIETVHYNQ
jgi:hypothetical protein